MERLRFVQKVGKMYKIGEFSKLSKTTIKTLRFYDEIGLFKPSKVEENGYRMYSVEDLNTISTIRELRSFGVSIDDVKKVLSGGDLAGILIKRYDDIESEIEKKRSDLKTIGGIIAGLKKGESMNKYEAVEKTIPSFNVYYRHGVIASMADILDFILGAGAEAKKNNPDIKCENYCYVTYEADEYQENNVELEYVEAVDKLGKESENVKFKTIPEITALCIEHKGAYANLGDAYAFALGFAKENGYTVCGKIREVYIHGCWDRTDEKDYLVEIQIPVRK